eukprot:m.489216 g.489216  ORF g.489216 m.489216 type:complete len:87 (+) comp26495_c0_seq1:184-444(+)
MAAGRAAPFGAIVRVVVSMEPRVVCELNQQPSTHGFGEVMASSLAPQSPFVARSPCTKDGQTTQAHKQQQARKQHQRPRAHTHIHT